MICSEIVFKVHKPGVFTSFQDLGRIGYQQFGVPVSGAMDQYACQLANILVGNLRSKACLEVTLIGPTLEACTELTIAITGADLQAKINGEEAPLYCAVPMHKGDILSFGASRNGVRAYIAMAGEFDCPSYFGSKSVDVQNGFGQTLEHMSVIKGISLYVKRKIKLANSLIPTYSSVVSVAVIEGPHMNHFTEESRAIFFKQLHIVEPNSNRMGYRLHSQMIPTSKEVNSWTDAVPFGGIQVPPNGQPIILMADRQTTGGYPRIGTVISNDIPKIAQLVPKGKIVFYPVSVEEAQKRIKRKERELYQLQTFRQFM